MNYLPNGIPPSGQDPGSSQTLSVLMDWIRQQQQAGAGASASSILPRAGTAGNLNEYASMVQGGGMGAGLDAALAGDTGAAAAGASDAAAAAGSSY